MAPLFWAALGLFLAPTLAAPVADTLGPTCVNKEYDGTVYTASNGRWEIMCGKDYGGGDMKAINVPTFEECIVACDALEGCIDVSYVNDSCYMKNKLAATVSTQDNCWTAKKVVTTSGGDITPTTPKTPLSCIDKKDDGVTFKSAKGIFKIECGKDYGGHDLAAASTNSFEECINTCDAKEGCVDVSYVWGACYMKSGLGDVNIVDHVWSAVFVETSETPETPSTITDAPADPTATTAPTNTPLSCDNKKDDKKTYGSPSGGTYQILCGVDYGGGDLAATSTDSFEECITACDKNVACVDVAFVHGACYLKKELNPLIDAGHVWTAKVLKPAKDFFTFPTATPQPLNDGTETIMDLPIELPAAPIATLSPVPPPGIDIGGLGVLTPDPIAKIWYNGEEGADEDSGATTVRLTLTYEYPSIILDYSLYIKDVTCDGGSLTGRFDTLTPYLYALSTWPKDSKFILITAASSCSPGDGQNAYFLAQSVTFNDATQGFSASGALSELKDLYTNMDIDFGTIQPDEDKNVEFGAGECGSPSQSVLGGLPAISCGPDFDKKMDELLTFYSDDNPDPTAILEKASPETGLQVFVVKRWSLWGAIKSVVQAVVKVVATVVVAVAKAVVQVVAAVVQKAIEVVVTVAKKVVAASIAIAVNAVKLLVFIVTGNYSNKLTLPVNMGPPSSMMTESPWGDAIKFYTFKRGAKDEKWNAESTALDKLTGLVGIEQDPEPGVELWCVNCGIKGKIVAEGSISATPLSGLTKGTIGVNGNMYAGLYLGVNAFAKWEKTFEKELLKKGLPGWSIPGIVTLGPQLILAIEATIGVQAEGQLLTGASLTWPAFEATLNFVDRSKSTRSGWTPVIDKTFQAHGTLEASAALGLPITVEFGIDILNGAFKKSVGLVDTPAITATAEFSIDVGTETNDVGTEDCYGIGWDISLSNEVKLEITDGPEFILHQWAGPTLAEGCIGWPKPGEEPEEPEPTTTAPIPSLPTTAPEDLSMKCPAAAGTTYTDLTSNLWEIRCNIDYPYNDMASNNSPDFESCINSCAATTGCVGVSWIRQGPTEWLLARSNTCYLKTAWGARRDPNAPWDAGPIDTALMMSPFQILSIMYSDRDITAQAASNFISGNRLVVNTNTLHTTYGDPWPGNQKSISMLYTYGAETRIMVAATMSGTIIVPAGPVSAAPYSYVTMDYPQQWGSTWLKIIGVAYGRSPVFSTGVWNSLYWYSANRANFLFSNANFGGDTWGGIVKTGVVWYRDTYNAAGQGGGDLYYMTSRENNYGRFWSPWGKRSIITSRGQVVPANVTIGGNSTESANATTVSLLLTPPGSSPTSTPTPLAPTPVFANNTVPSSNTTGPEVKSPVTTPLFSNTTLPSSNTTLSPSNTTLPGTNTTAPAPIQTPIFSNTTLPSSNTTLSPSNTTLPGTNTTAPAPIQTPIFSNSTLSGSNSTLPPSNTTLPSTNISLPVVSEPEFSTVKIVDTTNILELNAGTNGNLFLSALDDPTDISALKSASFSAATLDSTIAVFGDDSSRLLHYYPSTMSSIGASRLRLAGVEEIPKGARLISLVQMKGSGGEEMLMGIDTQGNYFFLMLCGIQGQLNKVFLVKDVDTGPAALETEEAKFTVTGGKTSECVPLALVVEK